MATIKEQLKCDCNSKWSNSYRWYKIYNNHNATPEIALDFDGQFNDRSICTKCSICDNFQWFDPSELNMWYDLRSMNTIW